MPTTNLKLFLRFLHKGIEPYYISSISISDLIVIMGCSVEESCPAPLVRAMKKKVVDWGLDDPKNQDIITTDTKVRVAFQTIDTTFKKSTNVVKPAKTVIIAPIDAE